MITPTPIPIDELPEEFGEYTVGFFTSIFNALKQIEIPFTPANMYDVFIGTIVVSACIVSVKLMYGKGGGGRTHE